MIRRALILVFLATGCLWAEGPQYGHKDAMTAQEFDNLYNDLRRVFDKTIPAINVSTITASSATITNASVTNLIVTSLSGVTLGKVKQVIFQQESTGGSTTSTSFVVAGASMTITPTSSSSRILLFGLGLINEATSSDGHPCSLGFGRNGTELFTRNQAGALYITGGVSSSFGVSVTEFYVDSPATTSPVTYSLMITTGVGTTTCNFGGAAATGSRTSILLMEVGA